MTAVWYRFWAELRTRWRSVFALTLLAGLAGTVVLVANAMAFVPGRTTARTRPRSC